MCTPSADVVISDSEAWTHQAAQRLGIPRIGFDHIGVIAYCKPHFPPELAWRVAKRVTPTVIRELMPLLEGQPEAAFFLRPEAPAKRAKARTATKKADGKRRRRSQNGEPSR